MHTQAGIINLLFFHLLVQDSTDIETVVPANAPQSTLSTMLQPTSTPLADKPSTSSGQDVTDQDLTQSNSKKLNDDDEKDCNSENNSAFLILVVLVMTIAILLLVVFILGTALVLVSLKLRNTKGTNRTTADSCNKDTYVGKQIVLIEEGQSRRSNFTQNNNHHGQNIDNDEAIREMDNKNTYNSSSSNNRNEDGLHSGNIITRSSRTASVTELNIESARRGRTDSSTTVSAIGLNAREYEDPQSFSISSQRAHSSLQTTEVIPVATYSHPPRRTTITASGVGQRVPVEYNANYIQVPSTSHKTTNQTAVHV